ncbi:hypothetical protein HHI36_024075 [Cryptolaemus montrouzieri]|uniref:Reverse transcriptase domain-containing protein n=1 Tax=Cryptolaemus montrouzieri TaxID=559131 RepID=A0ABD2PHY5_9CUCU
MNFPPQCTEEVLPTSFSRHNSQMLTMLRKPSKTKELATKDTKENKIRIFSTSKDVNKAYERFLDRMKTLIENIFTFKTIQQHDMKPWITQGIKISARRKNSLYHLKNKDVPEDMMMFADDTQLVLSTDSESIEDRVFGTLHKLDLWFTENELLMNDGKTRIVEFNCSVNFKRTVYNKRRGTATLESSEKVYLDHMLN